jgi:hypothetical protein
MLRAVPPIITDLNPLPTRHDGAQLGADRIEALPRRQTAS